MGECINLRRGGEKKKLPVLNPNFPADFAGMQSNSMTRLEVKIAEHGNPAEYTYQWFIDGSPWENWSNDWFDYGRMNAVGTHYAYCEVTNKAGTVRSRTATVVLEEPYLYNYGAAPVWWHVVNIVNSDPNTAGVLTTPNNNYLRMDLDWGKSGFLSTTSKVDLTYYSKIRFYLACYTENTSYPFWCCVASTNSPGTQHQNVAGTQVPYDGNHWYTVDVDISGVSGSHYVGVKAWAYEHKSHVLIGSVLMIP